jgi:hypothetical protein
MQNFPPAMFVSAQGKDKPPAKHESMPKKAIQCPEL